MITYKDGLSFYDVNKRLARRQQFEALQGSRKQKVNKVVLHHDGTRDSRGCFDVLVQRSLSTHILIDRDGTVYQPLALRDIAFHVGDGFNVTSVGIDLNNPVHPDRARERGAPVYKKRINNSEQISLGYTDAQYESLAAVLDGLFRMFPGIRREAPVGEDGQVVTRRLLDAAGFAGVVAHWHLKATKWDPGPGFDWERVLVAIRANRFFFPVTLEGTRNLGNVSKRNAPKLAEEYFEHVEGGQSGYFPVGVNQAWHTGVHFRVKPGTPVRAPADGRIVAARNAEPEKLGDANMVLIRHELEVGRRQLHFYSVLSHLAFEQKKHQDSRLKWMRDLSIQPEPAEGLPDDRDRERRSAAGHVALRNGWVALVDVKVKAGDIVGYSGHFAADGERPEPLVDVGIIAPKPVLPRSDRRFLVVDDDDDPGILCNARGVWRIVVPALSGGSAKVGAEALDGLVRGGYPLAPSDIRAVYSEEKVARELRWLAPRHVTEWNTETDFSGMFGGGVDFEWHTRKEARRYTDRIKSFLWWDKGVTEHAELPKGGLVYTYHPVALLTAMALGEARRAMSAGEQAAKGLDDKQLKDAWQEERREEREMGLADAHVNVDTRGLVEFEDLDAPEPEDPDREAWMRWEPGEWPPPEE